MRLVEAELAKVKLESEGIASYVGDQQMAAVHALVISEVPLLVREADVEEAKEILARPPPDATDDEYVDEPWRCPQCHRKTVDLLPLSRPWQMTRVGCLSLVALPLLLPLIGLLSGAEATRWLGAHMANWFVPWLVAVSALSAILLLRKRQKQCSECGHTWR
jgi:hypothetical protein